MNPTAQSGLRGGLRAHARAPRDTLFSDDGSTVDQQVAASSARRPPQARPRTIATAESCTGGLLAARLTELPGASDYVLGSHRRVRKRGQRAPAGVATGADRAPRRGPPEVADALAEGAHERLAAGLGVGITGVGRAGRRQPREAGRPRMAQRVAPEGSRVRTALPGGRADVRDRATTVALHMVRRLLAPKSSWSERGARTPLNPS